MAVVDEVAGVFAPSMQSACWPVIGAESDEGRRTLQQSRGAPALIRFEGDPTAAGRQTSNDAAAAISFKSQRSYPMASRGLR